jgi:heat shock protein HtpX
LALIQGVVNTFVIFFAKLFGFFVDRVLLKNDGRNGPGIGAFVAEIAAQLVLGIVASVIVMWFSRQREFRADAGGAHLAGREKMIAALERLKINHGGHRFTRLLMTHPPLDERIAALRSGGN